MAWPFSSPASAPTSFAGPGASVPTSATEIGGGVAVVLLGIRLRNDAGEDRVVTITNSAGNEVWKETVPAGSGIGVALAFEPVVGLKWSASGTSVTGHVWGY